jgi:NADH dehydrogenase [ubiquinone] 1 alpha subcomplex assembly factor 6
MSSSNAAFSDFLAELRAKDYERYLICLLLPLAQQADLVALFLLNAELARIGEQVSEPLLGQIRLQWWREGLDSSGTAAQPPHALLGWYATKRYSLGENLASALLTARLKDLERLPFADWTARTEYLAITGATLGKAAARLVTETEHHELCRQALVLYAEISLLRSIPLGLRQRRLLVPESLLQELKVNLPAFMELKPQAEFSEWALNEAKRLVQECSEWRKLYRQLPMAKRRPLRFARLHYALADFHSRNLIKHRGCVFAYHRAEITLPRLLTLLYHRLKL